MVIYKTIQSTKVKDSDGGVRTRLTSTHLTKYEQRDWWRKVSHEDHNNEDPATHHPDESSSSQPTCNPVVRTVSRCLRWAGMIHDTHFFFKQPHLRVEPRVAIKNPKMRLKVAMKLLSIFGIESQGCYVAWLFWAQMYGKQAKIGKFDERC